jgi:hypothetical protein
VLRSTADPADRIQEADEGNNMTATRIEIHGDQVVSMPADREPTRVLGIWGALPNVIAARSREAVR